MATEPLRLPVPLGDPASPIPPWMNRAHATMVHAGERTRVHHGLDTTLVCALACPLDGSSARQGHVIALVEPLDRVSAYITVPQPPVAFAALAPDPTPGPVYRVVVLGRPEEPACAREDVRGQPDPLGVVDDPTDFRRLFTEHVRDSVPDAEATTGTETAPE